MRVLDELVRVPVARDDDDVVATGLRLLRQRGDDVVRFEACEVHGHDPEGIDHLAHQPHLLAQDVGCLVPIALVGGDGVVSERPLGPVERGDDRVRLVVLHEVDQHRREAEDGVRHLATGRRHVRGQGEEGPIRQGVAVEKEDLDTAGSPVREQLAVEHELGDVLHPDPVVHGASG